MRVGAQSIGGRKVAINLRCMDATLRKPRLQGIGLSGLKRLRNPLARQRDTAIVAEPSEAVDYPFQPRRRSDLHAKKIVGVLAIVDKVFIEIRDLPKRAGQDVNPLVVGQRVAGLPHVERRFAQAEQG